MLNSPHCNTTAIRVAHLIAHILRHHAVLLLDALHVIRILPAKLGGQGNNQRRKPDAENHEEYASRCPQIVVVDIGHGPISVTEGERTSKLPSVAPGKS